MIQRGFFCLSVRWSGTDGSDGDYTPPFSFVSAYKIRPAARKERRGFHYLIQAADLNCLAEKETIKELSVIVLSAC